MGFWYKKKIKSLIPFLDPFESIENINKITTYAVYGRKANISRSLLLTQIITYRYCSGNILFLYFISILAFPMVNLLGKHRKDVSHWWSSRKPKETRTWRKTKRLALWPLRGLDPNCDEPLRINTILKLRHRNTKWTH